MEDWEFLYLGGSGWTPPILEHLASLNVVVVSSAGGGVYIPAGCRDR